MTQPTMTKEDALIFLSRLRKDYKRLVGEDPEDEIEQPASATAKMAQAEPEPLPPSPEPVGEAPNL